MAKKNRASLPQTQHVPKTLIWWIANEKRLNNSHRIIILYYDISGGRWWGLRTIYNRLVFGRYANAKIGTTPNWRAHLNARPKVGYPKTPFGFRYQLFSYNSRVLGTNCDVRRATEYTRPKTRPSCDNIIPFRNPLRHNGIDPRKSVFWSMVRFKVSNFEYKYTTYTANVENKINRSENRKISMLSSEKFWNFSILLKFSWITNYTKEKVRWNIHRWL